MKYNIVAKCVKGKEYIITDMIATSMSEAKFEALKQNNKQYFDESGEYIWRFIKHKDTDFSWWSRITKKLTPTAIRRAYFECDYNGDIRQF